MLLLVSHTEALLTGIATPRRHGAVSVQANLLTKANLLFSDLVLKAQMQLDPELELYSLPQRDLVRTDEDVKILVENFPEKSRATFLDWYEGYKKQVMAPKPHGPGLSEAEVVTVFNRIMDRLILISKKKYTFESRHEAILAPYDYFEFGQEYVKPLVNFESSYVRNMEYWEEASKSLKAGDNVVLFANHQTEADAAFLPLFFPDDPTLGRKVYYVAGGRVVGDPLAQPFSMGRNLFCVHSKKYIDIEEDKAQKSAMSKQNRKTLTEMSKAMKAGGVLIWIAPHGGRDRLKETPKGDRPVPADFEPEAIELFRSISSKADKPTHFYPMAMATYSIMPPPDGRNAALGEKRVTKFTGCAISLAPRVDMSEGAAWRPAKVEGADAKAEARANQVALCDHVFEQVCDEYELLEPVMADFRQEGYAPPNSAQPWGDRYRR